MELKNKIILVVGAAGLIGSEFSQSLIDNGAICILADRDSSKLNKLKKKLNCNKPNQIDIKKVDILNEKQIISLRKYINIRYKRLDGVVNLVANDPKMTNNKTNFKTFEDTNLLEFQKDLNVGITGMMLVIKHCVGLLKVSKNASVVNIASDLSIISPDHRLYSKKKKDYNSKPISFSIIKHGVVGLTKYLATYYGSQNIRFNSISPGGILHKQKKNFQKKISKLIPLGRMANIKELSSSLIYLLSDKSSYTTGTNLIVDGGRSVW